jgi:APA family basic amino acid/polyamine antiporter
LAATQEFFARKASGLVRQISAKDALMFNILFMGPNWTFIYIVYDAALYPGANVPLAQLLVAPLVFIVALTYTMLAVSMPRAGADFVWISRSIHPFVGFVESWILVVFVASYFGVQGGAFIGPAIGSLYGGWALITNNPGLTSVIATLTTPLNLVLFTVICIVITQIQVAAGTKNYFRLQWIWFSFVCLGILLYAGSMLLTGHDGFVANFNQLSGMNYANIIAAAQTSGYDTGFTTFGMLFGTVYAFLIYWGFSWSSFFAGEMKEAYRSQIIAIVGGVIIFAFVTWAQYQIAYLIAGQPFMHAASYLAISGNPAWTAPTGPWLCYLVAFATKSPYVAAIVAFSILVGVLGTLASYSFMITRVLFAWSFDRLLPTAFSNLDRRFHAPRNALGLAFVLAMVFVYLGNYTTLLNYLVYGTLGLWATSAIVGVAAAVFPYRRKDIFEKAPGLAKKMIGSVPLMAILGAVTAVVSTFGAITSALPQFTGAPVNPFYVAAAGFTVIVGVVYFVLVYWYNSRRGLDMSIAFREIPPL